MRGKPFLIALASTQLLCAQVTKLDLKRQSADVDFSGFPFTKPAEMGSALPSTCSAGSVFLLIAPTVPVGQNTYVCTAANTWTLQSAASLGSGPNLVTVSASSNTLNVGPTCAAAAPCNLRLGSTVFALMSGATATLTNGTGTAYIYLSSQGALTVGHNMTVTCAGGCVAQSGITAFPSDAYPIAIWTASTNGIWDQNGTDVRAPLGRDLVMAGSGLTGSQSGDEAVLSAPTHEAGFAVAFRGTDVSEGQTIYVTVPYPCTITDWAITSDGIATIQLWRVTDGGTQLPSNSAYSMNANGFSLTTGNRIHSTTLSDLNSTAIYAFDTLGVNLFATGNGASHVEFTLGCQR